MPATQLNLASSFAAITGAEHVLQHEDSLTVAPANTQQVSAILRHANENALTVTPTGGNTKQSWGNPAKSDIHLDLTRLNRVLEHPWQDLTCTVQAGCAWATLQQTLARHGQFVALDPLWPGRATVGGILATNDSGALRHRYGSLRDLVIGMTLVLADGTVARTGGKVVKNVAGYDLCKLVTGSFGTLAVITEATFRLHPLPQHTQTFTVAAPQAIHQLAPLMHSIRASHLLTQAVQLRGDSTGFHLDITLDAHPEAHQDDILKQMTEAEGLILNEAPDDVWLTRESLLAQQDTLIIKATMLPEDVPAFAQEVEEKGGQCAVQSLGVMVAAFPGNNVSVALAEEFRYHIGLQGGTTMLLRKPPAYDALESFALATLGEQPNTLPLMQVIKRQFDPKRTLNPGRFLAGI